MSSTLELALRCVWFITGWWLGFIVLMGCYIGWQLYRDSRP